MKTMKELSIPIASLIVAIMALLLTAIAVVSNLDIQPNVKACWIVSLVLPFFIFLMIWLRKSKQTTSEFPPLSFRPNGIQRLPEKLRENFPYSVNRTEQVQGIKDIGFCEKKPLVWLIHGDRNQSHERFLECVQWFHWENIKKGSKIPEPRFKYFQYPYYSNNFENDCMTEIWKNFSQDGQKPDNWRDLSPLIDNNCNKGPVILYTMIRCSQWDQRLFYVLLDIQKKLAGKRKYPLFLCILIIYTHKHKRYQRKITRQLKKYNKYTLPLLSNIESEDVDEWQNMSFYVEKNERKIVKDIFRLEADDIEQIFKKGNLPMTELAKIFKHCLYHQDKGDNSQ
ncbi:conserved hypothetical protein, membrane [Candidatus Magnetomorum sp. HK-1]|nr:conserved hypothetical protein, membrane [Candidatus Magnetomorum sp. HK-1]